jgi:hypothetical protein
VFAGVALLMEALPKVVNRLMDDGHSLVHRGTLGMPPRRELHAQDT